MHTSLFLHFSTHTGFNCFPSGPAADSIRRAPEHSSAFNRTVRLYQTLTTTTAPSTDTAPTSSDCDVFNATYSDKYTSTSTTDNTIDIPKRKLIPSSTTSLLHVPTTTNNNDNNNNNNSKNNKRGLTLADVKANPFLRKLIVHAAKNRLATNNNNKLYDNNDM